MQIVQSHSYRQVTSGGEVIAYPSPTYDAMYAVVFQNATARPMVAKKRDIAFREGILIEPNFLKKCFICQSEYDHIIKECETANCGGLLREPDINEKIYCEDLLKLRNQNRQKLEDVLKEISVDHDIADDGWLVARNIYQELNGEIIDFETVEFWRIHPGNAAFSTSKAERIGEYEYTCLYHRDFFSNRPYDKCAEAGCGRILHPVIAVRFYNQDIEMRYIKEEVFHGSEYNPTAIYGFPPALTMWYNLVLTQAQEKYMADYYVEKKWPTAAILIPAKKRDSAELFKERLDQATNKNDQARPVFRFDPDSKHKPEVLRLTDTPQEMEFIAVREESRMRMAAFWGISPIFNADVQASGGLNNESKQLTVMGWATETKQKAIRNCYLDPLIEVHKIKDWHFEMGKIEEEDAAAEVQLDTLKAQYAQLMMALNFKVTLDDEGKPTKFEETPEGASNDPFAQLENAPGEAKQEIDLNAGGNGQNIQEMIQETNIGDKLSGQETVLAQIKSGGRGRSPESHTAIGQRHPEGKQPSDAGNGEPFTKPKKEPSTKPKKDVEKPKKEVEKKPKQSDKKTAQSIYEKELKLGEIIKQKDGLLADIFDVKEYLAEGGGDSESGDNLLNDLNSQISDLNNKLKTTTNEIKEEAKNTKILKDGDTWDYYNNTPMVKIDLDYDNENNSPEKLQQTFKSELKFAMERLNIEPNEILNNLTIEFKEMESGEESTLAFTDYFSNKLVLNPDSDYNHQNTIRHELAHYFEQYSQTKDYHVKDKKLRQREKEIKGSRGEKRKKLINEVNQINDELDMMFSDAEKTHYEDHENGHGHGTRWVDTMRVLFGIEPKSAVEHNLEMAT